MLHIITALYRPKNLEKIWKSIPNAVDVTWHICKSNQTDKLENKFLKEDDRIIVHECDCPDTDGCSKRNAALDIIKDGYFCFLDDDTIFYYKMYDVYKIYSSKNYIGMVSGIQLKIDGSLRLQPSKPVFGKIDTGNVLSHHSCLTKVRWKKLEKFNSHKIDFIFWNEVFQYFNKKIELVSTPISQYNRLTVKD